MWKKLARRCAMAAVAAAAVMGTRGAWAWNYEGHLVVGEIAWQKLDAADKAAVTRILKAHPHYATYLTTGTEGASAAEKDEMAFVKAATWPDAVRPARAPYRPLIIDPADEKNVTQYHHAEWHFIDIAFVLPGDTKDAGLNGKGLDTSKGDAVTEIRKAAGGIASQEGAEQKAVDLAWVEHLVGDVHQPLHAVTLISEEFPPPDGDRGGNSIVVSYVGESGKTSVTNLHAFWDGAVGNVQMEHFTAGSLGALRKKAADFVAAHPEAGMAAQMKKDATPEAWAEESYALAKKDVYEEGAIFKLPRPRTSYELPAGYVERAHEVAESQVTLAGYRLAATVHAALKAGGGGEAPKP
ncbi:MAG TPA: S1/P1 nuclease [Phycisphaerae bacterium]|nr:S1/P1 nuclease [Phycisphaerae bacterium]